MVPADLPVRIGIQGSVTAYITKGEVRSQLGGGPVETFKVGQSFFEPPGSTHLISANASNTEPAELIAVFVADEGAELTTFLWSSEKRRMGRAKRNPSSGTLLAVLIGFRYALPITCENHTSFQHGQAIVAVLG